MNVLSTEYFPVPGNKALERQVTHLPSQQLDGFVRLELPKRYDGERERILC